MATANLFQRGSRFYVDVYDAQAGRRKQLSLYTSDDREAQRLLLDLQDALDATEWNPWAESVKEFLSRDKASSDVLCSVALERWLDAKRAEQCSPNTLRTYEGGIDLFLRRENLSNAPVSAIRRDHCERHIRRSDVSRATQRKRYRFLRAWLNWLTKEEYVPGSPLDKIKPPKPKRRVHDKAATPEDLEAICAEAPDEFARLYKFAFYTGMRSGELSRLKFEHIDRDRGVVKLYSQKSGHEGFVPLSEKAEAILDEIEADTGHVFNRAERRTKLFVQYVSKKFRTHRRAAGLREGLSFHGLRHGFCSHLAAAGKSALFIKEAARHADISTSARYVSMHKDTLREGLNSVF